jgi:MFS family permease
MSPAPRAADDGSALAPFAHRSFAVLWTATVLSNIGGWMQSAAAAWMMTELTHDPLSIALVQAASTFPMFLFALPAGALADILDRRRLLIVVQTVGIAVVTLFAVAVSCNAITADALLAFVFVSGVVAVVTAPAWQAIVPLLVPRNILSTAVSANSMGFNISRSIGPALAGLSIASLGMASPFWINAGSTVAVIAALVWWRNKAPAASDLPAEDFLSAMRVGLRHARFNKNLHAALVHSAAFFPVASVFMALLPLVARDQVGGDPELYGLLLGAIGLGAVAAAIVLPSVKRGTGADNLVLGATLLTALALALFAAAHTAWLAAVACVLAGGSWIAVIASVNVAAQLAIPDWVRGRGLAAFAAAQFAGITAGSVLWGQLARMLALPMVHLAAAIVLLATLPFVYRWKLRAEAKADFTPSMHWPTPVLVGHDDRERGPVVVCVEYVTDPNVREVFLAAIKELSNERLRDGAYDWRLVEDAAKPGTYVEMFRLDSWLEHLRQHRRVTNADRTLQEAVRVAGMKAEPRVRHFIGIRPEGS